MSCFCGPLLFTCSFSASWSVIPFIWNVFTQFLIWLISIHHLKPIKNVTSVAWIFLPSAMTESNCHGLSGVLLLLPCFITWDCDIPFFKGWLYSFSILLPNGVWQSSYSRRWLSTAVLSLVFSPQNLLHIHTHAFQKQLRFRLKISVDVEVYHVYTIAKFCNLLPSKLLCPFVGISFYLKQFFGKKRFLFVSFTNGGQ